MVILLNTAQTSSYLTIVHSHQMCAFNEICLLTSTSTVVLTHEGGRNNHCTMLLSATKKQQDVLLCELSLCVSVFSSLLVFG